MTKTLTALMVLALGSTALANDRKDIPAEPKPEVTIETQTGSPVWRVAFVSSALVTTALSAASLYNWVSWKGDVDSIRAEKPDAGPITADDCGNPGIEDKNGVFTEICRARKRQVTFGLLAGGMFVVTVFTGYYGFFHVTTREKRTIALVPTVSPQNAGAMLDIRW